MLLFKLTYFEQNSFRLTNMSHIDEEIEQLKAYYCKLDLSYALLANVKLVRKIFDDPDAFSVDIYLTAIKETTDFQREAFPGLDSFLKSPYALACKHLYEHGLLNDNFKQANFDLMAQHPDPISMAQVLSFINNFSLFAEGVGLLSDKNRAGADNRALIASQRFDPATFILQDMPHHFFYKNNLFIQKKIGHCSVSPNIALTPDAIDNLSTIFQYKGDKKKALSTLKRMKDIGLLEGEEAAGNRKAFLSMHPCCYDIILGGRLHLKLSFKKDFVMIINHLSFLFKTPEAQNCWNLIPSEAFTQQHLDIIIQICDLHKFKPETCVNTFIAFVHIDLLEGKLPTPISMLIPVPDMVPPSLPSSLKDLKTYWSTKTAKTLLEPFRKLLLNQFNAEDINILIRGLERKLTSGVSIETIESQVKQVEIDYYNSPNIDKAFQDLTQVCEVEALHISQNNVFNGNRLSLNTSLSLFRQNFSNQYNLTAQQYLILQKNMGHTQLPNFADIQHFMQKNGLTFQQLKFLTESQSGSLKLNGLLRNEQGLVRLREIEVPIEKLAGLNLENFLKILINQDVNVDLILLKSAPA